MHDTLKNNRKFAICNRCVDKMSELCQPVPALLGRRHLRSTGHGHLDFPRIRRATYGKQSFAYAGPSAWNSLPDNLRDTSLSLSVFQSKLKSHLFADY